MKIYTKKGDQGETSLFGGKKISKAATRIEAYGTVDELNSVIGIVLTHPSTEKGTEWLHIIQNQLFVLGADLATPIEKKVKIDRTSESHVEFLEAAIDEMDEVVPAMTHFILPGGSPVSASLHLARTVCRRAERLTVSCQTEEEISVVAIKYLNRLSDFLFVLARYENLQVGVEDTPWIPS